MKLSQICINRPVLAIVLSLVFIILGVLGYTQLTTRFQPLVFQPHLQIQTKYVGASSAMIEQDITSPLEAMLQGTTGLQYMQSNSEPGQSTVLLNFNGMSEQDFVSAQSQVLQEISGVKLPTDASSPVLKVMDQDNQIMSIGVTDDNLNSVQLINYVNNVLLQPLQEVSGVAEVQVMGNNSALRISLLPERMATLGITTAQIANALENNNTPVVGGQILNQSQQIQVNTNLNLINLQEFENLVIANKSGRLVHLRDVATVDVGFQQLNKTITHINGQDGVGLMVYATDDANPITVGKNIEATLAQYEKAFPIGMKAQIVYNVAPSLQQAVFEVYKTIAIAILLVIIMTFGFLGNLRATLIPIVTIPVCLISVFAILYACGFTINVITLLGLVLAVGLVVDDAIVVLENTYRHIEHGQSPLNAARQSINEISFAVLGITICLVAIYIPTLFMPYSMVAVYFQEFAFTLAGSVLISGFLALTLSPMMCAHLLKAHQATSYEQKLEAFLNRVKERYQKYLLLVLSNTKKVLIGFFALLVVGIGFFIVIPSDLLPKSELNYIFGAVNGPASSNSDYLYEVSHPFMVKLRQDPAVADVINFVNPAGNMFFFIKLKENHAGSDDKVAARLNKMLHAVPGLQGSLRVMDANVPTSGAHQGGLYFYIAGVSDYPSISQAAQKITQALQGYKGINGVFNNVVYNSAEYNASIDTPLASQDGVPISQITTTLSTLLGGYTLVSQYQADGYGYPIVLQLPKEDVSDPSILQSIYVANAQGALMPLSDFVTMQYGFDLPSRSHINGLRAGEVDINMAPGYSTGQIVNEVNKVAAQVLPPNLKVYWGGQAKNMQDNQGGLSLIFVLGVVFIYLVLAALFESFIDPFIILLTVPLCIIGAVIALYLAGGSLNLYTGIGLVTLIGLVSKHGVLITQFANEMRAQGMAIKEAIVNAATVRLRPILMTSATMILGAVPLVFATGTDATGRMQIGIVIVAGLLIGSFFSLFVVPVAYLLFAGFKKKKANSHVEKQALL